MDVGADPHLVASTAQAPDHRPRHCRMVCLEIFARRARIRRPLAAAMGSRALPFTVPLVVLLALYMGVHYGSFAAGGSDSYGYLSQARFWLSGIPRVEQPWVQDFSWPNREWVFSPLGYRPFSPDGTIVPTYPAGLPDGDGCVSRGLGGQRTVLCRARCWRPSHCGSPICSAKKPPAAKPSPRLAALMLLASPVFLTHVMVPMSDVPAAAGWTLVAVLVLKQRPLAAGIVAGLTLLVRPNLIPLALVPVFAWQQRREPLIRYAMGIVPGLLAVMMINVLLVRRADDDGLRVAVRVVRLRLRCRQTCAITLSGSCRRRRR